MVFKNRIEVANVTESCAGLYEIQNIDIFSYTVLSAEMCEMTFQLVQVPYYQCI